MKKIPAFLAILFTVTLLTSCSQEPPPHENKEQTGVAPPESPTVPSDQMVEKSRMDRQKTVAANEQQAKQAAEAVKQEATEAAEQVKTTAAETAEQALKSAVQTVPDVATVAQTESAASSAVIPPTTVNYQASMGTVSFDHAGHAGRLDCSQCHPTDPPQTIAIDKEVAHNQLCKVCHKESGGNAPTGCTGCHKK